MSKLARDQFNRKYLMPDHKVMGTLTDTIAKKLIHLVLSEDKADIVEIIDHINVILGTRISDISADLFNEPFTGTPQISQDYVNPTGVIFLSVHGTADLVIGATRITMQERKIYFVNERNSYHIEKQTKSKFIMLSGRFTWDPESHGT
ncbi:hypothetical protein N9R43_01005 [bacterium]|nr:hypothetical protein [bacterium]